MAHTLRPSRDSTKAVLVYRIVGRPRDAHGYLNGNAQSTIIWELEMFIRRHGDSRNYTLEPIQYINNFERPLNKCMNLKGGREKGSAGREHACS